MIKNRTKVVYKWIFLPSLIFIVGCSYVKERVKTSLGPHHRTNNYYLSPDPDMLDIIKISVAKFKNSTDTDYVGEKIRNAFIQELKKTKKFEMVNKSKIEKIISDEKFQINGAYTSEDLLDIARNHYVDGIILAEITHYHPYKPLIIGVKMQMVQTITGEVVWDIDEVYDTSQWAVANSAKEYYFRFMNPTDSLYKWDIVLNSMLYFTQFVSFELVNTLKQNF